MSEREARALAAGETIEVGGRMFTLRPVVIQHLCDLEREALRYYKRQYAETFRENADLLGGDSTLIEKKLEEVARWDLNNLPRMDSYDTSGIPITDAVRAWLSEAYGELPQSEGAQRALLASSLDSGELSAEKLREMSGRLPIRGRVRYDQWWVTSTTAGMLAFLTASLRYDHPDVTREEVSRWPLLKVIEAVRIVERITAASLGNGSGSAP